METCISDYMVESSIEEFTLAAGVIKLSERFTSVIEIGNLLQEIGSDVLTEAGFWIWDFKTQECYYSKKFLRLLGFSDTDHIKFDSDLFKQLMLPESLEKAMMHTGEKIQAVDRQTFVNAVHYKTVSGNIIQFYCSVTILYEDNKASILFGKHDYGR